MASSVRRKNDKVLGAIRAAGVAVLTYLALVSMRLDPGWGAAALAAAVGVLTLVAVDLGLLAALFAASLPIVSSNAVVGITFLVLAVVSIRYLGADGGQALLVVATATAASFLSPAYPVWVVVGVAGALMGAGEGALAAALACVAVEVLGLALGKPMLGPTITGGGSASVLLNFAAAPASLTSLAWVRESFGALGSDAVNATVSAVGAARETTMLVVQPLLWSGGAALAGFLARSPLLDRSRWLRLAPPIAGILATATAAAVVIPALGSDLPLATLLSAALSSAAVAAGFIWLLDTAFPLQLARSPQTSGHTTLAADDADVDELLRLIATAEDKLTSEHTTQKVVMITDMKSFSRMTEEDGSMLTAKAIQAHRDLLLPVIEKFGGHGKSTGGDGLVAAFDDPLRAMKAAAEMQRVLTDYNTAHPDRREMTVRIGIADGEVVLDRSGRPFIGTALNLAARVMNLADGGQAFATTAVVAKGKDSVATHSHGAFDLKNIAKPVEVVEILWQPGQEPVDPRTRTNM